MIVPTYNDWARLQQCIWAIEDQTLPKEQFEVIVVDNSEDGVKPETINFPEHIQLVHEPKPGSYVARNRGAQIAIGDILVFTDSDCIPDKNWLKNASKYFSKTCDLLGGKVEIFNPENGKSKYAYLYERLTAFPQEQHVPNGRGVTANLFVKNEVFQNVGGFDPSIKSGGDWEFTLRCTKEGYQMKYADDVMVKHPARNLRSIFKKHYRLTCGGALNTKKQYGYTPLRILGSHLKNGLNIRKKRLSEMPDLHGRVIVFSIDLLKFLYRTLIYTAILLRLINPEKVRE